MKMNILNYVPPILAFLLAATGVLGRSKDELKTGIGAINTAGWIVLISSFVLMFVAGISIYRNEKSISNQRVIAENIRPRLMNGIMLLVKPLCGGEGFSQELDVTATFELLQSDDNLTSVGKRTLVRRSSGNFVASGPGIIPDRFRDPYEVYDYYVSKGKSLLEETLGSFGSYLSEEEIISLTRLILDDFLNSRYHLHIHKELFDTALSDRDMASSPWNTVGLYYFNAVYEGTSARDGDLNPVRGFLQKAQSVVELLVKTTKKDRGSSDTISFRPCSS